MNKKQIKEQKQRIIEIGQLLWQKNLATGLNGNISMMADDKTIIYTGHKTCLGLLKEADEVEKQTQIKSWHIECLAIIDGFLVFRKPLDGLPI